MTADDILTSADIELKRERTFLVWSGGTLERAPSFDGKLHQLDGFELVEVEVGCEDLHVETDQ